MEEFDNGLGEKFKFDFDAPADSEVSINKLKKFISQDSEPTIIFYGGEPLLQLEKIKQVIDNIDARFCMQTNGKLLDKIQENYLKKFSRILISIDGDKKRTDSNRGPGSYDLILKNINSIRDKGFAGEIVARMTISHPDICAQVKYLIELIDKEIFDSIHWQLDACFYKNDFDGKTFKEFVKEYNQGVSDLVDIWVQEMKKGKVMKIYPFLGIFEDLYHNTKTKLRCGAGYANYTITTNGKITACPIMNNISDFYCGDLNSNIKDLKEIYVNEPCTSCKYLNLCGGRCLYSNYAKLWPEQGVEMVCNTIIHLIESIIKKLPEIKKFIGDGVIKENDFKYEKYFGPEIIP